jgi:hypothetical protein
MNKKSKSSNSGFYWRFSHIVVLSLVVSSVLILVWVGWLIWFDMTEWGKDLGSILFGSRANEQIGLGIGMLVIHYFLIGVSLLVWGLVLLLRIRLKARKSQHVLQMKSQKADIKNGQKGTFGAKSLVKNENPTSEEYHFSDCPHYFGYLSSRPEGSAIPQECILCHRLGDCMVATLYVKKINK